MVKLLLFAVEVSGSSPGAVKSGGNSKGISRWVPAGARLESGTSPLLGVGGRAFPSSAVWWIHLGHEPMNLSFTVDQWVFGNQCLLDCAQ